MRTTAVIAQHGWPRLSVRRIRDRAVHLSAACCHSVADLRDVMVPVPLCRIENISSRMNGANVRFHPPFAGRPLPTQSWRSLSCRRDRSFANRILVTVYRMTRLTAISLSDAAASLGGPRWLGRRNAHSLRSVSTRRSVSLP